MASGMPPIDNDTKPLLFTTVWRTGVDGKLVTKWYENLVSPLEPTFISWHCLKLFLIGSGMPESRPFKRCHASCVHGR